MEIDVEKYKDVFLSESRENLSLINQKLLELENGVEIKESLDELFRAVHTIKGMSASMAYEKLTKLSHAMENVLDKLRSGGMSVEENIVSALFAASDVLEALVDDVEAGVEKEVDIDQHIRFLNELTSGIPPKKEESEEQSPIKKKAEEGVKDKSSDLFQDGKSLLKIETYISKECLLKAARATVVLKELESIGEVIDVIPAKEKLQIGDFGDSFEVYIRTSIDQDRIRTTVGKIPEVERVEASLQNRGGEQKTETVAVTPESLTQNGSLVESATGVRRSREQPVSVGNTIRVKTEQLDSLLSTVSELVILRNRIEGIVSRSRFPELDDIVIQLSRLITRLQDDTIKIRMVPVWQVFDRFPRMVRDISVNLGKKIEFIVAGKEIELDRSVLDQLVDPLVHLLRNAIDHGIEPLEERRKLGKPETGKVVLTAQSLKDYVLISVEDDGGGIDLGALRSAAVKKGVISSTSVTELSDSETISLLGIPGLTTATEVTNLSGRGVGLDVVKSKVHSLGGSFDVKTERGRGTRFEMRLPPSVSIIGTFIFYLGEERYAVPISYVEQVLQTERIRFEKVEDQLIILDRGKVLPLTNLSKYFGLQDGEIKDKNGRQSILVTIVGNERKGLLVDRLLGQQDIVVKSLTGFLKKYKEFMGVTILGDGKPALILNVPYFFTR